MALEVQIDSTPLTHQPMSLRVNYREAPAQNADSGGDLTIPWTKARTVTMVWPGEHPDDNWGVLAELEAARAGSDGKVELDWTLPDGSADTMKAFWATDPDYVINDQERFDPIIVVFEERPD